MKKLAILLLTILPFISFSQIAANETNRMNPSTTVIIETYTKTVPEQKTANYTTTQTYSEDDFKLFYDVKDHSIYTKKSNTSTKSLLNYSEDDFKMFYDVYGVTDRSFDEQKNKSATNAKTQNITTRIIRVYENPKVFYEVEVEETLDSNNQKIYQYHESLNRTSKTLLDVKQGGNQ